MKIFYTLLVLALPFSTLATENCIQEKEQADYWNLQLKHKVTERKRTKHREAKKIFLECIRQEKQRASQKPKDTAIINRSQRRKHKTRIPTPTANVNVSDFTGFNGKKKQAWNAFYRESKECAKNRSDMNLFVQCAKVRKKHLTEFNRRWDEQSGRLKSILQ